MNEKNVSKYLRLYPIKPGSTCLRIHYRNIENLDFNELLPDIRGKNVNKFEYYNY